MQPLDYEHLVSAHFRDQGYRTEVTPGSNDYGVDIFAWRDGEKIAIQAKMYGGTNRKINRQAVMELHGAKDYFDCTRAVIATNGQLLADAIMVAEKLHIEILFIDEYASSVAEITRYDDAEISFESIWQQYILPLEGKTLTRDNGNTNEIIRVDWSGVERRTSNGNKSFIKIEIFKLAVHKLLSDGYVSRDYINQNYVGRASSGVVLILEQAPCFIRSKNPAGLVYRPEG